MLFVLGQVYDRELGDPERAIETYSSIMDLDPEDYDAAQALDRLYQQTGRWYDLLAVLERQTELAPSPAEVVSLRLPHRRAVARAPEGSGPRRRGLPRGPGDRSDPRADDARAGSADGRQGRAGAGGRRAGADLRERGRVGSRDRGLRGDGGAQRRRAADRRAAVAASPRSRSAACRTRTPPSTSTGARCASIRTTRTCWRTWSGWPPRPATGPSWRRCCAARDREGRRSRAAPIDLLLRLARIYEEETGQLDEAIATYRRAHARPIPTASRRWSRSIGCYARAQQWDELAEVVRKRDPDRADRRGPRRAHLPAGADLRAGAGRHAQGRRGLPRHPERRPDARRDARRAGTDVPGRHDAARDRRRPGAAVPHGRGVGEAAPDLRGAARAADRRWASGRRCCGGWPRSPSTSWSIRSRRSAGGPRRSRRIRRREQALDELLRLARATHQWDAYVTTMSSAASRRSRRRPSGATCCCGWPPASRTISADLERAGEALRPGAERAREGSGGAGVAGSHLREPGDVREPGGDPAPAHHHHRRQRRAGDACTCASGGSTPRRSDEVDPAIASYLAVLEQESHSRDALDALERLYFRSERWPELYGIYEKLVDVAKDDEPAWPTATRAWPSWPPTRWTIAPRRSSCGAASSTSAARTPSRCRAWPICTRWPASGRS